MRRFTLEERAQVIKKYYKNNNSIIKTQREFRRELGQNHGFSVQAIRRIVKKFEREKTILDLKPPTRQRLVRSEENIATVAASIKANPEMSIRSRSAELGISRESIRLILRLDLGLNSHKLKVESEENVTLENEDDEDSNAETGTAIEKGTHQRKRKADTAVKVEEEPSGKASKTKTKAVKMETVDNANVPENLGANTKSVTPKTEDAQPSADDIEQIVDLELLIATLATKKPNPPAGRTPNKDAKKPSTKTKGS